MTNEIKKGRPAIFAKAKAKVDALQNLDNVSYYLKRQLVQQGLINAVKIVKDTRGRPEYDYQVSGKGRGLIAMSKNWK